MSDARRTDTQPARPIPSDPADAAAHGASVRRALLPYVWDCGTCGGPEVMHVVAHRTLPWGVQRTRQCQRCRSTFDTMERRVPAQRAAA
jgi:hypothetical protein